MCNSKFTEEEITGEITKKILGIKKDIKDNPSKPLYSYSNEIFLIFETICNYGLSKRVKSDLENFIFDELIDCSTKYIKIGEFYDTEKILEDLIMVSSTWDKMHDSERIHKGELFFYLGIYSLIKGNTDKCYLSIYQSYQEDRQLFNALWPKTYSSKFLLGQDENQVYDKLVKKRKEILINSLKNYREEQIGIKFAYSSLKRIIKKIDPHITIYFYYGISKLSSLDDIKRFLNNNEFINQINLNVISIFCTCFEFLLKKYYPATEEKLYSNVIEFFKYHQQEGLKMVRDYKKILGEKNKIGELKFIDNVMNKNTIGLNSYNPICKDVIVIHQLRNLAAHEIVFDTVIENNIQEIYQSFFNVFFFICQKRVDK